MGRNGELASDVQPWILRQSARRVGQGRLLLVPTKVLLGQVWRQRFPWSQFRRRKLLQFLQAGACQQPLSALQVQGLRYVQARFCEVGSSILYDLYDYVPAPPQPLDRRAAAKISYFGPFKAWRASRWRRSGVATRPRRRYPVTRGRRGIYPLETRRKTNCNCKY